MTSVEYTIIRLINEVRDNLWLGDVNKARKVIGKQVLGSVLGESTKEHGRASLTEHLDTLDRVRRIYNDVRSELRTRRKDLGFQLTLSKEFRNRMIDQADVEMKNLVLASLFNCLEKLSKRLERFRQKYEVIDRKSYSCVILDHSSRYEVKGLLRDRSLNLNESGLSEKLRQKGYQVSVVKRKRYLFLRAYSTSSYIELSVFVPRVSVLVSLVSPGREKALELGEEVISSLAKFV